MDTLTNLTASYFREKVSTSSEYLRIFCKEFEFTFDSNPTVSSIIRGGSRKNFDILKIATPQAAPKDHTQKLQLCYERTIEGYYFLWHFNQNNDCKNPKVYIKNQLSVD